MPKWLSRFAKRHPVLLTGLGFAVLDLPQWLSAVWSCFCNEPLAIVLSRRFEGNLRFSFSPYWITVPAGLSMFVIVLYELRRQRHFAFTYAYSLALAGIQIGRDDNNPEGAALQLSLILRNAADGPLRYHVEQFDVIIDDRTISHPVFTNRGAVISKGLQLMFSYPSFGKEAIRDRSKGVIRYSIIYGHPEVGFSRRAKKELNFNMRADKEVTGLHYTIRSESDEEIAITDAPPN